MKAFLTAVLGAGLALTAALPARAGEAYTPVGPIHVTGFIEVVPTAAATNQMLDAAKQYRDAAKGEPGAITIEVYQEAGAPSRLVTREIWRDPQAADAHAKAASSTALAAKLKSIQYGPADIRAHDMHFNFTAPGGGTPAASAVVIVSHLDVGPPALPPLIDAMKPLGEGSAKEQGVVTYQMIRQTGGARNHFRLFEVWASQQAWEAHNLPKLNQDFRDAVYPLLGTPYDQRKYQIVN